MSYTVRRASGKKADSRSVSPYKDRSFPDTSLFPSAGLNATGARKVTRQDICRRFMLLLLCFVLLMPGCAIQSRQSTKYPAFKYQADSEEHVSPPYTPRDDGQPLTAAELHAFRTTGDLDRDLSQENARIVELHFKHFVHQDRRTFSRFLERSSRFLPHVKKVFTDRGIPEDIAYLLMVESGGNPKAVSPAGAAGLWQFMPLTGKRYGLKQDNWVDERRDPYKATLAAADYLLKLYNDFSNWHLAVAAYNAGEGKIGRALNGTGASDFFDLCRLDGVLEEKARLRDETRDYVPRLIAVAKIMRNLNRLGFEQPSPGAAWDLVPMSVPPSTNLAGLAKQLGYDWDEFSGMNPAFRRTASPPNDSTTAYVPHERLSDAVRWVASNDARTYASWKEYTVRKGDTLASIAKRHQVTVAALREANNISKLPKRGAVLLIPGKATSRSTVAKASAKTKASERAVAQKPKASKLEASKVSKAAAKAPSGTHVVQPGDTLYGLALKWGTSMDSIRSANKIDPKSTTLKLGQRLTIPSSGKKAPQKAKPAPRRKAAAQKSVRSAKTDIPAHKTPERPEQANRPAPLVLGDYTTDTVSEGSRIRFPRGTSSVPTGLDAARTGRSAASAQAPRASSRVVAHATFRTALSLAFQADPDETEPSDVFLASADQSRSVAGQDNRLMAGMVEDGDFTSSDQDASPGIFSAALSRDVLSSPMTGGASLWNEIFPVGQVVKEAMVRVIVSTPL